MATGSRVTVTTGTAQIVVSRTGDGARANLHNAGGNSVDLGGSGLTAGTGYELAAGQYISIETSPGEDVYAVASTASSRVDVLLTTD